MLNRLADFVVGCRSFLSQNEKEYINLLTSKLEGRSHFKPESTWETTRAPNE